MASNWRENAWELGVVDGSFLGGSGLITRAAQITGVLDSWLLDVLDGTSGRAWVARSLSVDQYPWTFDTIPTAGGHYPYGIDVEPDHA